MEHSSSSSSTALFKACTAASPATSCTAKLTLSPADKHEVNRCKLFGLQLIRCLHSSLARVLPLQNQQHCSQNLSADTTRNSIAHTCTALFIACWPAQNALHCTQPVCTSTYTGIHGIQSCLHCTCDSDCVVPHSQYGFMTGDLSVQPAFTACNCSFPKPACVTKLTRQQSKNHLMLQSHGTMGQAAW